jgi:DUF4097 and DUF4098 domain-containing protein YvlB
LTKEKQMMIKRKIIGILIALAGLLTITSAAFTQTQPEVSEEFHQTYPLAATGRVSLENINGSVHIKTWDRNEIKVDAVKTASRRELLSEAEIKIDSFSPDSINIHTEYPRWTDNWNGNRDRRHEEPPSVEYTLTIPRSARLESIELINGALDIDGVAGEVKASSINGRVTARALTGEAKLSTINGSLEATFDRLAATQSIVLNSVNGHVTLIIPSDTNAQIKADTVHGNISNDFGLPVRRGEYVGRDLAGTLGSGGARIKLGNVNGQITIRHASDGRPISAATSLLQDNGRDDGADDDTADTQHEIERATREAAEDAAREATDAVGEAQREAQREAARAAREAQREAGRAAREATRETARAVREAQQEIERHRDEIERAARMAAETQIRESDTSSLPLVERQAKSFNVSGTPRLNVETFDGAITVHSWNKPEVSFTAVKRARDEQAMRGIRLRTEQRGAEIFLVAEFDKTSERAWGAGAVVQFDLYVPQSTNLRASSGDGRLLVEGINGEMDLQTGDGAVDVSRGRGRLRVNTGDGRIHITDYDGDVNAETGDGRITLAGRFTRLSARTGDGAISLALPADFNATIETNAESVVNDGLAVSEDTDTTRRTRRWKVGRGGNLFTLSTGDGRIILQRADNPVAGQE